MVEERLRDSFARYEEKQSQNTNSAYVKSGLLGFWLAKELHNVMSEECYD